jgi:hypothetical protein
MPRWVMIAAGVVVFLGVASQILIPAFGERAIEDRLTEGGGTAEAKLGAFPAVRLLFGDGERLEAEGSELELALDPESAVFERLDGFSIVDISILDSRAGPLAIESFELQRDGGSTYQLAFSGSASAAGLARAGLDTVDLPGESVIDVVLGELFGDPEAASVPIELDVGLSSADGRVQVVSGEGTVAGIPSGALAELITSAVVVRI